MQMNGNAEMLTVAKYWKSWSDPRLIFLVLNNNDLNQVTWEQRITGGYPKFTATQDLPPFDYGRYAEDIGLLGITVTRPQELGAAWDRALRAERPVILTAHVSGDIAQLPPHISFEEAHKFLSTLVAGDPNEGSIIKEQIKSLIAGTDFRATKSRKRDCCLGSPGALPDRTR